eukprot:gene10508-3030_t
MKITFKTLAGKAFELNLEASLNVAEVKKSLTETEKYNPDGLKLVFNGSVLKDDQTLESLKLTDTNFIVVLGKKTDTKKKPKTETTEQPKVQPTTTTTQPTTQQTNTQQQQQQQQQLFQNFQNFQNTQQQNTQQQNTQQNFGLYDSPDTNSGTNVWDNVQSPTTPDVNQMLSNPMYQQMMLQMMQDPGFVDMLIQSNPELAQLSQSNPQLRQMLSSPEFLQSVMQMQGLMGQGQGQGNQQQDFSSMFGGMNLGQQQQQQQQTQLTEDEAKQQFGNVLIQLKDMGFSNEDLNVQAVIACNGDLNLCIDWIMNNMQ